MIHADEREIVEFLHAVAENRRYSRRVWLAPLGQNADNGRKMWLLYPEEDRALDDPATHWGISALSVDRDDIASLYDRGYLDGPDPRTPKIRKAYTLSRKGQELHARGYAEVADSLVGGTIQNIYAYGGTNAIAQTGTGDIAQHIAEPADIAAIRALLADLREALVQSEMAEEDREEYQSAVERLDGELVAQAPRWAVILRIWAVIQTIGAAESFLQAGERASALVEALTPHMQALFSK